MLNIFYSALYVAPPTSHQKWILIRLSKTHKYPWWLWLPKAPLPYANNGARVSDTSLPPSNIQLGSFSTTSWPMATPMDVMEEFGILGGSPFQAVWLPQKGYPTWLRGTIFEVFTGNFSEMFQFFPCLVSGGLCIFVRTWALQNQKHVQIVLMLHWDKTCKIMQEDVWIQCNTIASIATYVA